MSRIFISYKRADKNIVFPIKDKIEAATGEKCWIDLDGIESDAQFVNVIMQAIEETDLFLFMYSQKHAAIKNYEKDWTIREIMYAQDLGKRIVFINLDNAPLSKWFKFMFGLKQQVDARSNSEFEGLLVDMRKWLGKTSFKDLDYNIYTNKKSPIIQTRQTDSAFVRGQKMHLVYCVGYILASLLLFVGLWSNRDMFPERMQPIHYFMCMLWLYIVSSIGSCYSIFKRNKIGVFWYYISSYILYFVALFSNVHIIVSTSPTNLSQYREDIQFMWIFSFIASLPLLISSLSLNLMTKGSTFYKNLGIGELTQKFFLYTNIVLSMLLLVLCITY